MEALKEKIEELTKPFEKEEFLSAAGLYALASIGGNNDTIPFLAVPETFNIEEAIHELETGYIHNDELTELSYEVITALNWAQMSTHCLMMNDLTFFFQEDATPVSVFIPNEDNSKFRVAHRYKSMEIIAFLGFFPWLNQFLQKEEILSQQDVEIKDVINHFKEQDSLAVALFVNGKIDYNCVFIDNAGGVIKYDETVSTLEEKAGIEWLQEILQIATVNNEFQEKRGF